MLNKPKSTPNNIDNVNKEEFEKITGLLNNITSSEEHFNELSSKYKLLASTWLLSVFGGIGFTLVEGIEPRLLIIAAIGFAGSIGIYLLWLTDLKVYQQLLSSNFVEGLRLEKQYDWLPKIRHNMMLSQETGSVSSNLAWYYVIGCVAPFLIGSVAFMLFIEKWDRWLFLGLAIVLSVVCTFLTFRLLDLSSEKLLKKFRLNSNTSISVSRNFLSFIFGVVVFFIFISPILKYETLEMNKMQLTESYDYLAPDGSEIRLLPSMKVEDWLIVHYLQNLYQRQLGIKLWRRFGTSLEVRGKYGVSKIQKN